MVTVKKYFTKDYGLPMPLGRSISISSSRLGSSTRELLPVLTDTPLYGLLNAEPSERPGCADIGLLDSSRSCPALWLGLRAAPAWRRADLALEIWAELCRRGSSSSDELPASEDALVVLGCVVPGYVDHAEILRGVSAPPNSWKDRSNSKKTWDNLESQLVTN